MTDRILIRTTGQTGPGIAEHLADTSDAHDASAISVLDTAGNYTATDVEACWLSSRLGRGRAIG